MKQTLYDLLAVRRDATRAEIERAYDQTKAMAGGAAVRDGSSVHLIEEAFATLSNPARREAYDASLRRAAQLELEARSASAMIEEPAAGRRRIVVAVLAALVVLAGGWYWKSSHDAAVAMERQAELRRIEAERLAVEAEAEKIRAENEQMALRQAAEDRRSSQELQRYSARYGVVRSQSDYAEQRRLEMEQRQAERDRLRQDTMARQAADREMRERQRREAEDRRYLDQFKPGMNFAK
jgi:hypothetical protein